MKKNFLTLKFPPTANQPSKTSKDVNKFKTEAYKCVCALLNSDGGELKLETEMTRDEIVRPIEQNAGKYLGSSLNEYLSTRSLPGKHVMTIKSHKTLCTMNFNAYLPTDTQALEIKPNEIEKMREILDEKRSVDVTDFLRQSELAEFVYNQSLDFHECTTMQFKKISDEKRGKESSKNLADHLKNNNLTRFVSAFANYHGGRLYCGVRNDGIVEGQEVKEEDKGKIIQSMDNYIKAMVWPEVIGEPIRCEEGQWDISFVPVTNQSGDQIWSKYVVILTIRECPGGVFEKDPESYLVVDGAVQKMKFNDWKKRIQIPNWRVKEMSPRNWSSEELRDKCEYLDGALLRMINDGDWEGFENLVVESDVGITEIGLVVLCKWCTYHYRRDQFKKAEYFLKALKAQIGKSDDASIFDAKRALVLSAFERAKGNHWESFQVAKELLAEIEQITPCLLTVESYIHFATMLTINQNRETEYAKQLMNDLPSGRSLKDEVLLFYHKAIQHLEEISYIPESQLDRRQKAYIHMAIFKLGCSLSDVVIVEERVLLKDIEEAATCLQRVDELNTSQHSTSDFRKCHFLFAQACLFFRKAEHEKYGDKQEKLLESAMDKVESAVECAELNKFKELFVLLEGIRNCLSKRTKIMIKSS